MLEELEVLMDERVRPILREHGGDAHLLDYKDGILRLRMLGQCAGCPAADLTNETIIEAQLKEAVPGLQKVVLVNEVSSSLLEEAKRLMQRSRANTPERLD